VFILYRFRVIVSYSSKMAECYLPYLYFAPRRVWPRSNFAVIFGVRKLESLGYPAAFCGPGLRYFRRFTDTNVYGTGSVKIRRTRHKISVDVRLFLQCMRGCSRVVTSQVEVGRFKLTLRCTFRSVESPHCRRSCKYLTIGGGFDWFMHMCPHAREQKPEKKIKKELKTLSEKYLLEETARVMID